MPALTDEAKNKQFSGGKSFESKVADWSRRHDPFNRSCQAYESRGGHAHESSTFDDGTYAGKSYQLLFGGNGSGIKCSGSGETTASFRNSYVRVVYGGSFKSSTGTDSSSTAGVHQNRAGEHYQNASNFGGDPAMRPFLVGREVTKNCGGSAQAFLHGGSVAFSHLNTFAAMGKNMNCRFDNVCINADTGALSLASTTLAALYSTLASVAIATGPAGGIGLDTGAKGFNVNYGAKMSLQPGPAAAGAPWDISDGQGTGVQWTGGFLQVTNPKGIIHIQPGGGVTPINNYEAAITSPPGAPDFDIPLPPDPTEIEV